MSLIDHVPRSSVTASDIACDIQAGPLMDIAEQGLQDLISATNAKDISNAITDIYSSLTCIQDHSTKLTDILNQFEGTINQYLSQMNISVDGFTLTTNGSTPVSAEQYFNDCYNNVGNTYSIDFGFATGSISVDQLYFYTDQSQIACTATNPAASNDLKNLFSQYFG